QEENTTLVLVTHDEALAKLCARRMLLDAGDGKGQLA
ncbi:MAG TPA: ABC transporter, partial [Gammaproteobacteria bacterium]|nr:ABC transporter [Gammaproteobacteria bacterium]